jgi:hypothetical protein
MVTTTATGTATGTAPATAPKGTDGEVELCCRPAFESLVYTCLPWELAHAMAAITVPVQIVVGSDSKHLRNVRKEGESLREYYGNMLGGIGEGLGLDVAATRGGHFGPLEFPREYASVISEVVAHVNTRGEGGGQHPPAQTASTSKL